MTVSLEITGLHGIDRDEFLRQAKQQGVTPAAWFALLVRHARTLELGLRPRRFLAEWEKEADPLTGVERAE